MPVRQSQTARFTVNLMDVKDGQKQIILTIS